MSPKKNDFMPKAPPTDEPLVDQPALAEICPCKSGKPFGGCCGADFDCDCKSHLAAGECCYDPAMISEVSSK